MLPTMRRSLHLFRPGVLALCSVLMACGDDGGSSADSSSTTVSPTTTSMPGTTADPSTSGAGTTSPDPDSGTTSPDPTTADSSDGSTTAAGPPTVVMETTLGTIVIEMAPDDAPITVENFLAYANAGFFDGTDGLGATIVHRVIPGFVIQAGGLTETLQQKATMPPIMNEFGNGLLNVRGSISMARTNNPDSATSQFFINLVDNDGLDDPPGYAVFGRVIEGMDVVDTIAGVPTTTMPPYDDVPVDPVNILSATVE